MKKIILLILSLTIIIISCQNDGGSIYAMEKRYRNFLNILPDDVKNDYTLESLYLWAQYLEDIRQSVNRYDRYVRLIGEST